MIYDFKRAQQRRNGNGIYQGHDGLRQAGRSPDLGWWRDRLNNLQELSCEVFPPLMYAVPYLFPQGVTLLVGRPKIKKSWMLLQIACAIAKGDITLASANGESPPQGNVLYLGLEDNKRRLQDRVTRYYGANGADWPPGFQYALEWLRLEEGGLDGIGEWCLDVPNPRLIVIDTLARVRSPKQFGQTDYEADMEAAQGLIRLCTHHNGLSIICAHHDRKQEASDVYDTVSGTLGLQGGVDTIAILKKSGGGIILYVKGRDLKEEIEKAVAFDDETCRWHVLGEAAVIHQSDTRKSILEHLRASGSLTPRQLADQSAEMTLGNAKMALWRMARDGILDNDRGTYRLHQESSVTAAPGDQEFGVTAVTGDLLPDEDL